MNKILFPLCASLIAFPLLAFAADDTTSDASAMQKSSAQSQASITDPAAVGDLSWLAAVNQNEIAAGKLAKTKATNPDVKQFAEHMISAHTQNLNQDMKVSHALNVKLADSSDVVELKNDGKKELATLKGLKGKEFDTAYIDAMVKGHTKVLNKLDSLIADAKNAVLQQYLTATREEVKHHLQMAQDVQQKLGA